MNNLLSPTSTPGRNFKNTISVLDEYRVEYGMSEVSEVRYVPEAGVKFFDLTISLNSETLMMKNNTFKF